jgi:hypothetical protein
LSLGQEKLQEAEPLNQRARESRQLMLGKDHPDTLSSVSNYAWLLLDQGKLTEVEPLFREVLECFDHP